MLKISTYRAPASLFGSAISDMIRGASDGGGEGGDGGGGAAGGEGGGMSKHSDTSCSTQARERRRRRFQHFKGHSKIKSVVSYPDHFSLLLLLPKGSSVELCVATHHRKSLEPDQLTSQQSLKVRQFRLHWQGAPGTKVLHRSPSSVTHAVVHRNNNNNNHNIHA